MPDLEAALTRVARDVEFPPTPSIAPTVGARLRADATRAHRPPFAGLAAWPRRRVVVALALALVLVGGAAVAARLAIGPVSIEIVPSAAPSAPPEAPAAFGDEVSLTQGLRETGIRPAWPRSLGPPDDVYVVRPEAGGAVLILAWRGDGEPIPDTPWTAVLYEMRSDTDLATKYVAANVIHPARVGGRPAFWISGAHDLSLAGAFGGGLVRVSGNVLIWEREPGLAYRLETMRTKADAVSLADSIR
jgi:hypothetical protein